MEQRILTESGAQVSSALMNQGTAQKQLVHEEYNSAENRAVIYARIAGGRARDISDERKVDPGTAVIIIGSGPSLDDAIPLLGDWKGGVICTTSHARTLLYHGIEPSHIFALDPFCTYEEIAGVDWSKTRTKLIAHPGVWPSLLAEWPNDILLYRQFNGQPDSYYSTWQNRAYTRRECSDETIRTAMFKYVIRTELTLFACSPPAQLFAAQRLGYGNAFLCGVDFGYHSGKERFTEWKPKASGDWEAIVQPSEPAIERDRAAGNLVKANNGAFTSKAHLFYKKNMISALRLTEQNVWTTDKYGTLQEVPYVKLSEVVRKQGKGFRPARRDRLAHEFDEYLASIGAYVLEAEGGAKMFVESTNPDIEIPQRIIELYRHYHCTNCGAKATANDWENHVDGQCPYCGEPKLARVSQIDLLANMARLKSLPTYGGQPK